MAQADSDSPEKNLPEDEIIESFRLAALDLLIVWAKQRSLVAKGMTEDEARKNCAAKSGLEKRIQTLMPDVIRLLGAIRADTSALYDFQYQVFVGGDFAAAKAIWPRVAAQLSALSRNMAQVQDEYPLGDH